MLPFEFKVSKKGQAKEDWHKPEYYKEIQHTQTISIIETSVETDEERCFSGAQAAGRYCYSWEYPDMTSDDEILFAGCQYHVTEEPEVIMDSGCESHMFLSVRQKCMMHN